ncbi:AAA family ATPase [Candidatus Woesearchaeota archaeon]|nr:MAG: AAA family ATPase [Candidatus Woesearchaeota archaeon]
MASNNKVKNPQSQEFSYDSYEDFAREENSVLRHTISKLKEEMERYKSPALMLAEVFEINNDSAVIRIPNGNKFLVNISQHIADLKPGDCVAVEQRNLTIVKKLNQFKNFEVERFVVMEKPRASWHDIGGLKEQCELVREVIELPLLQPELFKQIGIKPPKGILLYGPPGTGKTLLGKAVAHSTNSTFIQVVGSELVQKFIGEGAKLVKEIFALARERAPAVVFIDELDALGSRRVDIGTSGEREVQRTFMQLLSEIDGFQELDEVKIIGCTNRIDILDPAILRPGRLDRLIYVPVPDQRGVAEIFDIHTKQLTMEKIDKKEIITMLQNSTGAEIKSVVTEAGYVAIRKGRSVVQQQDFFEAVTKLRKANGNDREHLAMFG